MTTYHFSGPSVRRQHKGTCPACGKKVTRSRTFENTVNPFNRHPTEDRPKTWDEVREDVKAQADRWVPDFTCQGCDFAADVVRFTVGDLLYKISQEAYDRMGHRRARRHSRADLCNDRIGTYEKRIYELEPTRIMLTTSYGPNGRCCYFEFPDRQRCILGERHGDRCHISPSGQRVQCGLTRGDL